MDHHVFLRGYFLPAHLALDFGPLVADQMNLQPRVGVAPFPAVLALVIALGLVHHSLVRAQLSLPLEKLSTDLTGDIVILANVNIVNVHSKAIARVEFLPTLITEAEKRRILLSGLFLTLSERQQTGRC